MLGTRTRSLMMLLAGALPALTGCVMEPGAEPDQDGDELAGALSLPPADPCNSPFSPDPEHTLAIPLLMYRSAGSTSRLPVDTGWYTNVLIQNTSSSLATVRLRAIPATDAEPERCVIFSLASETAVNFRPDNHQAPGTIGIPTLPAGTFEGSMLIETDRRLAAVARLSNVQVGSMGRLGGTAIADYQSLSMRTGATETGRELAYPYIKSGFNGKSTTLLVQNVESWGGELEVQVRTNDAKLYTYSTYVTGRRSVAIYPWQLTRDPELPGQPRQPMPSGCTGGPNPGEQGAPCFGSVRIVSRWARFGAIAVEHPASGNAPAIHAAHFEAVEPAPPAPDRQWISVVKNQYQGATTGIGIMNVSGTYQDVTVILRKKAVPWIEYRYTFEDVPPYRSVVVSPGMAGFPAGEIGAAEISSTGPITVVANEAAGTGAVSFHHAQGVPADLAAPLVKVDWFGRKTRTTLWNVGSQAVQIMGRYRCHTATSGTYSEHTHTMTAGANIVVDFEPVNIPAGNLCSAIFTTAQQTLVGTFSEVSIADPLAEGSIYEGIVLD